MPRPVKQMHGRFVRPEIFKDSELIRLELKLKAICQVRMVLIGVWEYADKRGRFEWDTFRMHMEIMPHMPFDQFEAILEELHRGRWLCRHGDEGEYGHVRTWNKYQRTHRKERDSVLPQCLVCGEDSDTDAAEPDDDEAPVQTKKARATQNSTEPKCEKCGDRKTVFLPDPRPYKVGGLNVPCPDCQGGTVTQDVFFKDAV